MLDLYNTRQYNDNVYNSKMNLSYGNKKIDIENEKGEEVPNHLKDASRDKNSFVIL